MYSAAELLKQHFETFVENHEVSVCEGKLTHILEYFDPAQAAYTVDSPVMMPG